MEKRFKSKFTGADIEALLSKAQNAISSVDVTDSYTEGKSGTVFSGVGAKALYDYVNDRTSGETLKTQIEAIPGVTVFTDADKAKLDKVSDKFVGSFLDIASRNAFDTSGLVGNEICFVRANELANPMFYYWEDTLGVWVKAIDDGISQEEIFPALATGTHTLKVILAGGPTAFKYILHAKNGAYVQTSEVLISTNYADVFYTDYALLLSDPNTPMYQVYAELDVDLNIIIKADVYLNNTTIKMMKSAEL